MSNSVQPRGLQPTRLLCPWDSPGKNTGVGCHFLLQGIFPTQGSNLCLLRILNWQADSLLLGLPGKPNQNHALLLNLATQDFKIPCLNSPGSASRASSGPLKSELLQEYENSLDKQAGNVPYV